MPPLSDCNFGPSYPNRNYTFSVGGKIQSLVYGVNTPPICIAGPNFIPHTDCTPYSQQVDYQTFAPDCDPEDPLCRTDSKSLGVSDFGGTFVIVGGGNFGTCNSETGISVTTAVTVPCDGSDTVVALFAVQCDQEYQADCTSGGACVNTSTIAFLIGASGEVTYQVVDANCDETSVSQCIGTGVIAIYQRRKAPTDTWMAEGIYYLVQVQNREQIIGTGCANIPDMCGTLLSPITSPGVPPIIVVTGY